MVAPKSKTNWFVPVWTGLHWFVVALEHCGGHFSGGARALRTHVGQMAARSKGLNCRQDQRTQVLKQVQIQVHSQVQEKISHGT